MAQETKRKTQNTHGGINRPTSNPQGLMMIKNYTVTDLAASFQDAAELHGFETAAFDHEKNETKFVYKVTRRDDGPAIITRLALHLDSAEPDEENDDTPAMAFVALAIFELDAAALKTQLDEFEGRLYCNAYRELNRLCKEGRARRLLFVESDWSGETCYSPADLRGDIEAVAAFINSRVTKRAAQ